MDITFITAALLLLINFVSAKIRLNNPKGKTAKKVFFTLFGKISDTEILKCGNVFHKDPTDTAGFKTCIESLKYPRFFEERILKMTHKCFEKNAICCVFCDPMSAIYEELAKDIEGKCAGTDPKVFDKATYDKILKEFTGGDQTPEPTSSGTTPEQTNNVATPEPSANVTNPEPSANITTPEPSTNVATPKPTGVSQPPAKLPEANKKDSETVSKQPSNTPKSIKNDSQKSSFEKLDVFHYGMAAVILLLLPTVIVLAMQLRKTKKYDTEKV